MYDRSIDALKASLRGALLQPDDAGYEMARKVYNGMIDRRPRFIARCSNVADVITAGQVRGQAPASGRCPGWRSSWCRAWHL